MSKSEPAAENIVDVEVAVQYRITDAVASAVSCARDSGEVGSR